MENKSNQPKTQEITIEQAYQQLGIIAFQLEQLKKAMSDMKKNEGDLLQQQTALNNMISGYHMELAKMQDQQRQVNANDSVVDDTEKPNPVSLSR